ncbi:MAG: hypothetical protein RLZZ546_3205, partial [Bacteroidota bacterium]
YSRYLIACSLFSLSFTLINIIFFKRLDLVMTTISIPLLIYGFVSFYLMMDIEVESKLFKMFIISNFLMHGVSLLIFILKDLVFSFNHEQQISIFLIRSLVFLLTKILILIPTIHLLLPKYIK